VPYSQGTQPENKRKVWANTITGKKPIGQGRNTKRITLETIDEGAKRRGKKRKVLPQWHQVRVTTENVDGSGEGIPSTPPPPETGKNEMHANEKKMLHRQTQWKKESSIYSR